MHTNDTQPQSEIDRPASGLPAYETPAVATFTDEQLLEALGPAQAGRSYGPPG